MVTSKAKGYIVIAISVIVAVATTLLTHNLIFPLCCGFIAGEAIITFKIESWYKK